MIDRISRALRNTGWSRSRLGLAVSGGSDSVALAVAVRELARLKRVKPFLKVLHVNHGLRGRASGGDQRFVRALARRLGMDFDACKIHIKRRSAFGLAPEQEARTARYEALRQMAVEARLRFVLTAHTADDQAETVLLHMARGAGLGGISGIPARRTLSGRPRVELLRPALAVTRDEMRAFLAERGIGWREDASNRSPGYARNRVRQKILPMLAELVNPRSSEHIVQLAALAADAREFIEGEALARFPCLRSEIEPALKVAELAGAPRAIRRRAVRLAALRVLEPGAELSAERVEAALALLECRGGARCVELGGGAEVASEYGMLLFRRRSKRTARASGPVELDVGRTARFGPWSIECAAREKPPFHLGKFLARKGRLQEVFDAGAVTPPLLVRGRLEGDRFALPGGHTRKLKKALADAKVPAGRRDEVPVVTDGAGRVLWAVDVARAHEALVGRATRRVLVLRARNVGG